MKCIILLLLFSFSKAVAQQDYPFYFQEITESPFVIDNLIDKGNSFYAKQEHDSALYCYKRAWAKSQYSGYGKGLVNGHIGVATVYRQLGNYEQAIQVLKQALPYCKIKDNTIQYKAYIYNLMAVNYGYRGMYEEAAQNYETALHLSETHPHPQLPATLVLNNLAMLYSEIGMPDKALAHMRKIEVLLHSKSNPWVKLRSFWTYAYLYEKAFDFSKTKRYLDSILLMPDSVENETPRFMAYWKLADIALQQKRIKDAQYYLSMMQAEGTSVERALLQRKNTIAGRIFLELKDYASALKEYQQALIIAEQARSLPEQANLHGSIAQTYAGMRKFEEAYEQEQLAKTYRDSVNKGKQARNIAVAEARYQSVQKDKAIAEKNKAIAQRELRIYKQNNAISNRNVIIGVALFFIGLLLVVFYIAIKSHRQKQKLQDEKILLTLKEQELNRIGTMMDVEEQERTRIARDIHDGLMIKFSTLMMNLSALFDGDKEKEPYLEQLDGAITSLRNVAHNLMPDILLEGGLTEAIYYFCENIKEEVNFEIVFNFLNDVPRFDEKFEISVYRIVQELIQNIVKHAKAGEAYVQMGYSQNLLHITVEDNGIGMEVPQKSMTGLGLKSIQNRMIALNGTMEISSENNAGTSIVLEFIVEEIEILNG